MPKSARPFATLLAALFVLTGCEIFPHAENAEPLTTQDDANNGGFVSLFNGEDLSGWTPKITGYKLGEDPKKTFRAQDGVLQVRYDNYDTFNGQFGHLFLDTPYSHYVLRLEYRFVGEKQLAGNPGAWAYKNSGVMIHGQAPDTMGLEQSFPNSIEVQLLGQADNAQAKRTTANICSPGTEYFYQGELIKAHCKNSTSKTFRGEQWVKLEIEVHGNEKIIHRVNGDVVFEYTRPQLDDGTPLSAGSISLQSESHACDFRNIEIKKLK